MQIAGSNLLLAAQAAQQAQRAKPAAAPAAAISTPPSQFEPMTFAKAPAAEAPKPQAATLQPGTILRPGSQLDIRI